MKHALWILGFVVSLFATGAATGDASPCCCLTLIPPSPVSDQITLSVHAALRNETALPKRCEVKFYLDEERESALLHQETQSLPAGSVGGVYFRCSTRGWAGDHRVVMCMNDGAHIHRAVQRLKVYRSEDRSIGLIDGAWSGFYMWGNEGLLWNEELVKMTEANWRELMLAMQEIGMNIIVVQEMFRNAEYVDAHDMEQRGYRGKSFYPSRWSAGRMEIASPDPLETILTVADEREMHVFVPVGLYAWFDFSEGSLQWHKNVANELWQRYGRHPSFYGWYVSEEIHGWLSPEEKDEAVINRHHAEIVHFFKEFRTFVRALAPDKPVMLASNSHHVPRAAAVYPKLLAHLDILCPFGFHRMPPDDISGEEAAGLLQRLCDDAGMHLWMDLEVFLFGQHGELYPRPINGLISDLQRFPNFEKILCFQFSGLLNAPWMSRKPGGEATVQLFSDYKTYYDQKRQELDARVAVPAAGLPLYKDASQPVPARVQDLRQAMTLEEKIELVSGRGFTSKRNVRLGIPEIVMTDGPLGPNAKGRASNYSSCLNMAATWDDSLVQRLGAAMGQETRVLGRNMLLGPCINIARVPQGGRTFEGFGEDPWLTSRMAVAYIQGVQSQRVIACAKHFAVNNQEWNRGEVDVTVREDALREIYLAAFKAAVQEADVWSVMSAYNKFRGDYCSASRYLLTDVLKQEWGFAGFVVSDWGGVHHTVQTVQAGLDLEMPDGRYLGEPLRHAVQTGEVAMEFIDEQVRRLLTVMFKAGLFDESVANYGGLADTEERRRLAYETAQKSMVLLKNESQVLPLDPATIRSLAVIGPNADEARLYGGGSGYLPAHYAVSPLQGIREKVGDRVSITFVKGGRLQRLSLPAVPSDLLHPPPGALGDKGLLGEYFNNRELEGEPVLTRIDERIDFNWDADSPAPGVVAADLFSVRWSGSFVAPGSGVYELGVLSDNGCRLYLDGRLVIDSWIIDKASSLRSIYVDLEKNRVYPIRLEFFENVGTCEVHLGLAYYGQGNEVEQAEAAARSADVAVVCAGLNETLEGEGNDRASLGLAQEQVQLIQAVAAANPRTIVVLNNATPILMNEWADRVPAILEAFYPGQEGGRALADILFGDVNPSGKLPLSFPARLEDSPVYTTYPGARESADYAEGLLVGYRHFDRKGIEPLFPFGHGLSYTRFSYNALSIHPAKIGRQDTALITLRVKNSGALDGEEVVQLYMQNRQAKSDRPVKELKGFMRVPLRAGEEKTVRFNLAAAALSVYDVKSHQWVIQPGSYSVLIASSSRDIRLQDSIQVYQK
ncbi:DUF4434 domain-containing protein [bacterium]|nr:DUF4434 domain-containing protein [bacterium]